ncbi:MAG: RAMP superfamily CRISPR-associated protein [Deltaproteobacteria bacterium]|nr:RAMP superfamily CRISPR-associated protein [Deltaproteobacteria bacterium]
MTQINPYNFVPLEPDKPVRSEGYPGRLKFHEGRYSGMFKCTLEALGPLISIDQRKSGKEKIKVFNFLKNYQHNPIIQGSSLKGMIRSIYEAITDSCMTLACTHGKSIKRRGDEIEYKYQDIGKYHNNKCSDIKTLCPSCRLFGTINNDDRPCQGRVRFSDAVLKQGELIKKRTYLKVLSNPKPHHHATYGKSKHQKGPIAGRKFYYHHGKFPEFSVNERNARRSIPIEAYAKAGNKFEFEVYVENLDKEEFKNFILALELHKGFGHKIGLGKAIGLGSCCITINRDQSFITIGSDCYKKWEAAADTTWYSLKKDKTELPDALIEVLRLNKENDDGKIGYPHFRNYPKEPIDAKGVFGGSATEGGRPCWPDDVATEPPKEPTPEVSQGQEATWLKENLKQALIEEKRKQEELILQKEQERNRQLKEKRQEEEIRKAKEQRAAELKAMTPEQRILAELDDSSILENRIVEIYNKIDEFSEENKRAIALALKKYWERYGKWGEKKGKKTKAVLKQMKRIETIKAILEES